jgi:hypothetical protein
VSGGLARRSKSDCSRRQIGLGSTSSAMSGRARRYVYLRRPRRCILPPLSSHHNVLPLCQLRLCPSHAVYRLLLKRFQSWSWPPLPSPHPLFAIVTLLGPIRSWLSMMIRHCDHTCAHHSMTAAMSSSSTLHQRTQRYRCVRALTTERCEALEEG